MTARTCCVCNLPGDLRPYGPKGADICFTCMKGSPERETEAGRQFGGLLAAAALANVPVVLTNKGPRLPTKGDA